MYKLVASLLLVVSLVGCGSSMPKPNSSGPVQTLGGGFLVDSGKLRYGVTYRATSQSTPLYATVEFENPESKTAPILVKLGALSLSADIIAQSPPFGAIRNDTNYTVILYVYSDPAMTQPIHKHSDQVRFSMPAQMLKQLGVRTL